MRVKDSFGCNDHEMQRVQNSSVQDCEMKLLSRETKATSRIIALDFGTPDLFTSARTSRDMVPGEDGSG